MYLSVYSISNIFQNEGGAFYNMLKQSSSVLFYKKSGKNFYLTYILLFCVLTSIYNATRLAIQRRKVADTGLKASCCLFSRLEKALGSLLDCTHAPSISSAGNPMVSLLPSYWVHIMRGREVGEGHPVQGLLPRQPPKLAPLWVCQSSTDTLK